MVFNTAQEVINLRKKSLFIAISLILIIGIAAMTYIFHWNSKANVTTRSLENKLIYAQTQGQVQDLFDFDYDEVYFFEPYQPKQSMESLIGFKCNILKETISEGMMNILFVKDNSPVAYLYGYPSTTGYHIDLPVGTYTKAQLDAMHYTITEHPIGDSSTYYMDYTFTN